VHQSRFEGGRFRARLSYFFNAHNDLFRKLPSTGRATAVGEPIATTTGRQRSFLELRFHAQTAGCSPSDAVGMNLIRVAYQALAGVLGGCQSLHTNSMDETLALPSEHAVTLALRTQQVLLTRLEVNTVDRWADAISLKH
jgi:methylmalonyl-CoA mutase N-terminal domain/subunit